MSGTDEGGLIRNRLTELDEPPTCLLMGEIADLSSAQADKIGEHLVDRGDLVLGERGEVCVATRNEE